MTSRSTLATLSHRLCHSALTTLSTRCYIVAVAYWGATSTVAHACAMLGKKAFQGTSIPGAFSAHITRSVAFLEHLSPIPLPLAQNVLLFVLMYYLVTCLISEYQTGETIPSPHPWNIWLVVISCTTFSVLPSGVITAVYLLIMFLSLIERLNPQSPSSSLERMSLKRFFLLEGASEKLLSFVVCFLKKCFRRILGGFMALGALVFFIIHRQAFPSCDEILYMFYMHMLEENVSEAEMDSFLEELGKDLVDISTGSGDELHQLEESLLKISPTIAPPIYDRPPLQDQENSLSLPPVTGSDTEMVESAPEELSEEGLPPYRESYFHVEEEVREQWERFFNTNGDRSNP